MNREIKFRAGFKGKIWDVVEIGWKNGQIHDITIDTDRGNRMIDVRELELFEFTGLKDFNGRELYEGDILHFSEIAEDKNNPPVYGHVYWSDKRSRFESNDIENLKLESIELWGGVVIGNIYENPNLLK